MMLIIMMIVTIPRELPEPCLSSYTGGGIGPAKRICRMLDVKCCQTQCLTGTESLPETLNLGGKLYLSSATCLMRPHLFSAALLV